MVKGSILPFLQNEHKMKRYIQTQKQKREKLDPVIWLLHFFSPKWKRMSVLNKYFEETTTYLKNYYPDDIVLFQTYSELGIPLIGGKLNRCLLSPHKHYLKLYNPCIKKKSDTVKYKMLPIKYSVQEEDTYNISNIDNNSDTYLKMNKKGLPCYKACRVNNNINETEMNSNCEIKELKSCPLMEIYNIDKLRKKPICGNKTVKTISLKRKENVSSKVYQSVNKINCKGMSQTMNTRAINSSNKIQTKQLPLGKSYLCVLHEFENQNNTSTVLDVNKNYALIHDSLYEKDISNEFQATNNNNNVRLRKFFKSSRSKRPISLKRSINSILEKSEHVNSWSISVPQKGSNINVSKENDMKQKLSPDFSLLNESNQTKKVEINKENNIKILPKFHTFRAVNTKLNNKDIEKRQKLLLKNNAKIKNSFSISSDMQKNNKRSSDLQLENIDSKKKKKISFSTNSDENILNDVVPEIKLKISDVNITCSNIYAKQNVLQTSKNWSEIRKHSPDLQSVHLEKTEQCLNKSVADENPPANETFAEGNVERFDEKLLLQQIKMKKSRNSNELDQNTYNLSPHLQNVESGNAGYNEKCNLYYLKKMEVSKNCVSKFPSDVERIELDNVRTNEPTNSEIIRSLNTDDKLHTFLKKDANTTMNLSKKRTKNNDSNFIPLMPREQQINEKTQGYHNILDSLQNTSNYNDKSFIFQDKTSLSPVLYSLNAKIRTKRKRKLDFNLFSKNISKTDTILSNNVASNNATGLLKTLTSDSVTTPEDVHFNTNELIHSAVDTEASEDTNAIKVFLENTNRNISTIETDITDNIASNNATGLLKTLTSDSVTTTEDVDFNTNALIHSAVDTEASEDTNAIKVFLESTNRNISTIETDINNNVSNNDTGMLKTIRFDSVTSPEDVDKVNKNALVHLEDMNAIKKVLEGTKQQKTLHKNNECVSVVEKMQIKKSKKPSGNVLNRRNLHRNILTSEEHNVVSNSNSTIKILEICTEDENKEIKETDKNKNVKGKLNNKYRYNLRNKKEVKCKNLEKSKIIYSDNIDSLKILDVTDIIKVDCVAKSKTNPENNSLMEHLSDVCKVNTETEVIALENFTGIHNNGLISDTYKLKNKPISNRKTSLLRSDAQNLICQNDLCNEMTKLFTNSKSQSNLKFSKFTKKTEENKWKKLNSVTSILKLTKADFGKFKFKFNGALLSCTYSATIMKSCIKRRRAIPSDKDVLRTPTSLNYFINVVNPFIVANLTNVVFEHNTNIFKTRNKFHNRMKVAKIKKSTNYNMLNSVLTKKKTDQTLHVLFDKMRAIEMLAKNYIQDQLLNKDLWLDKNDHKLLSTFFKRTSRNAFYNNLLEVLNLNTGVIFNNDSSWSLSVSIDSYAQIRIDIKSDALKYQRSYLLPIKEMDYTCHLTGPKYKNLSFSSFIKEIDKHSTQNMITKATRDAVNQEYKFNNNTLPYFARCKPLLHIIKENNYLKIENYLSTHGNNIEESGLPDLQFCNVKKMPPCEEYENINDEYSSMISDESVLLPHLRTLSITGESVYLRDNSELTVHTANCKTSNKSLDNLISLNKRNFVDSLSSQMTVITTGHEEYQKSAENETNQKESTIQLKPHEIGKYYNKCLESSNLAIGISSLQTYIHSPISQQNEEIDELNCLYDKNVNILPVTCGITCEQLNNLSTEWTQTSEPNKNLKSDISIATNNLFNRNYQLLHSPLSDHSVYSISTLNEEVKSNFINVEGDFAVDNNLKKQEETGFYKTTDSLSQASQLSHIDTAFVNADVCIDKYQISNNGELEKFVNIQDHVSDISNNQDSIVEPGILSPSTELSLYIIQHDYNKNKILHLHSSQQTTNTENLNVSDYHQSLKNDTNIINETVSLELHLDNLERLANEGIDTNETDFSSSHSIQLSEPKSENSCLTTSEIDLQISSSTGCFPNYEQIEEDNLDQTQFLFTDQEEVKKQLHDHFVRKNDEISTGSIPEYRQHMNSEYVDMEYCFEKGLLNDIWTNENAIYPIAEKTEKENTYFSSKNKFLSFADYNKEIYESDVMVEDCQNKTTDTETSYAILSQNSIFRDKCEFCSLSSNTVSDDCDNCTPFSDTTTEMIDFSRNDYKDETIEDVVSNLWKICLTEKFNSENDTSCLVVSDIHQGCDQFVLETEHMWNPEKHIPLSEHNIVSDISCDLETKVCQKITVPSGETGAEKSDSCELNVNNGGTISDDISKLYENLQKQFNIQNENSSNQPQEKFTDIITQSSNSTAGTLSQDNILTQKFIKAKNETDYNSTYQTERIPSALKNWQQFMVDVTGKDNLDIKTDHDIDTSVLTQRRNKVEGIHLENNFSSNISRKNTLSNFKFQNENSKETSKENEDNKDIKKGEQWLQFSNTSPKNYLECFPVNNETQNLFRSPNFLNLQSPEMNESMRKSTNSNRGSPTLNLSSIANSNSELSSLVNENLFYKPKSRVNKTKIGFNFDTNEPAEEETSSNFQFSFFNSDTKRSSKSGLHFFQDETNETYSTSFENDTFSFHKPTTPKLSKPFTPCETTKESNINNFLFNICKPFTNSRNVCNSNINNEEASSSKNTDSNFSDQSDGGKDSDTKHKQNEDGCLYPFFNSSPEQLYFNKRDNENFIFNEDKKYCEQFSPPTTDVNDDNYVLSPILGTNSSTLQQDTIDEKNLMKKFFW